VPDEPVHVWWAHTEDLTDAHAGLLDDVERARLGRLERDEDRDRFVLGAAVLRALVARLDGTEARYVALDRTCPRCGAQHGPVATPGRPWQCSVSSSGTYAVAAVASHAVGVDVETTCPPDWRALLPDLLTPGEQVPPDETGFLSTWVRKEAVVKATREGLSRPLSSVDLAAPPGNLAVLDLDIPGATAAVAVAGSQVRVRRWPEAHGLA
jgi:4'-phosphopantetheinyl transferase